MDSTMNLTFKLLAFGDEKINSNPRLRYVDWTRDIAGFKVSDPKSESHRVDPGQSRVIFDGTRPTTIDGTTTFSIQLLSSIDGAQRYRITHTGGTNPGFRNPRSVPIAGVVTTFTTLSNGTVNVVAGSSVFGAVAAGDIVFIPHTVTGDAANVFSVLNAGFWTVAAANSATNIVLLRSNGDFEGVSETVTPTLNSQFQVFSAAGVQTGDSVDITAGFSTAAQRTFTVQSVTAGFIEILSSLPIPDQTGIVPTATGMLFYTETKSLVYLESSQEISVRVNGDTGNFQRTSAIDPSDPNKPGVYLRVGPCWSLTIVNRSNTRADVTIIHAE